MPDLSYRSITISGIPATLDKKSKSVGAVVATEEPTEVFDFERYEVVPEILLMSGVEMANSRQVPLLDSHQRFDSSSVIGSVRGLVTKDGQLEGTAHFSNEAKSVWEKVREGHLTDFSVGYRTIDSQWIPEGEIMNVKGRSFEGPVRVTKRWRVREVSVVPIGADELAKARTAATTRETTNAKKQSRSGGSKNMDKATEEKIKNEERDRCVEITAMCRRYECDDLGSALIADGATLDAARKTVLEHIDRTQPDNFSYYPPATITHDEVEKRSEATIDGLVLRAGVNLENPAHGANEYRVLSLVDIARECLVAQGEGVRGLSKNRIIYNGLQQRAAAIGDFPYIVGNTLNKVLRVSYDLTPSTHELWCNLTDAADFKEMSRNQLSEAPALIEVPEHGEYTYGKFAESKEVFAIAKYGKLFAITREALINDDLSAFTRIPQAFAASAKRGLNQAAYAVLTANSAMADGTALFHADHGNYVGSGSGAAPSETTVSDARVAMRTQTGLQGALLNISPQFLIVPAALETTADKLLNSLGDLADNKSSGVVNPFYKKLEPVVESILDATSSTAWYLAADPKQVDTVEIAFLHGNRAPYLETKQGWSVDGVEYKVRFEYGAKAIDWRGLYCNDGV